MASVRWILVFLIFLIIFPKVISVHASSPKLPTFDSYVARPPHHIKQQFQTKPVGMTPDQVKAAYKLPTTGGTGTIAIVDAFDYPSAEKDLNVFSKQFHLPECQTTNGCLEIVNRGVKRSDTGWNQEAALDIQWAHAIAPAAKILLVEARSANGRDFLDAIDYARRRHPVAISLSWGGPEFPASSRLDVHFSGVPVFAAAGDSGSEVEWPAVSRKIVAVGGTSLTLSTSRRVKSETAWEGSGGGLSKYVTEPEYQLTYGVPNTKNHRAVPDVSYNADPETGFAVYTGGGWAKVGGTSAGAPQWAAIAALGGGSAINENFYIDAAKSNYADFFRDVRRGTNGSCKGLCSAGKKYDYITGLGSPQTVMF